MTVKSHTTGHDSSAQEEIVLSRHDEDAYLTEEHDDLARRERTVARLRLLWVHRSRLFRIAAFGLLVSTVIAFLIPSRYTSETRLMPPDSRPSSGLALAASALTGGGSGGSSSGASGLGGVAASLLGLNSSSDIFVGILNSRTAQDTLIQKFDLRKVYSDRRIEDARKDLANHTSIEIDRKSQIITIGVTDRSPQRAAAMARAYVEELDRLVAEMSTSSARRERIFLEGRLQGVNQDLETAERTFSQFASKNTAIDVPAQGKAMVDAAAVLQGQLIAAQSELQGLKQIYTDNNVRVRSVTARVTELQGQLSKLVGHDESGPEAASSESASAYPSIRKLPVLGVTYADLYRQTKVQEAVYETLTQEYELAKVEEAKEIPTVKVLDSADVPSKKTYPPRLLLIILGSLLAVSGGIICIYGEAAWQATEQTDPRMIFAQEVVSSVRAQLPWGARNGSDAHSTDVGISPGHDEPHNQNGGEA
jgi:uncharacterized protein involved in exopolysaccharide biosynthesis